MPWQEVTPVEQRLDFIHDYETGLFTMTELAAQYGISRKTGYKWVERYAEAGVPGLQDRSRRPHTSPQATAPALVAALIAVRRRHPRWGAKKLLAVAARRDPHATWPSRSTVCDLLTAQGVVVARRRAQRSDHAPAPPLTAITRANQVWTTDFKGEFRTGDGRYCHPLTLRDGFSRFVLRCDALLDRGYVASRRRFERAFQEYGLPDRIRSDNGGPFASPGLGRLSRLSIWWLRLAIIPERIAPGHPEQNGSHEQFHSVLKADTTRPPARDARAQQRRFARFCLEYNEERPHEALHDQPPASCYVASARSLPRRLSPVEYPGHFDVRRVSSNGCVSWRNAPLFIATALEGEDIAFEEVGDGLWTIHFAMVALARYDERQRTIHPIAPLTTGRSAAVPPRA
jgi:transposase InsO family protein